MESVEMLCPNENIEMHQVKIESHYGLPIILEQCGQCGGIWFDESELYRAKQGEAGKIELLDSEVLRARAAINDSVHVCPKDRTKLYRFTDKNFPEGIVVERCPVCSGFWLNRGSFTRYQEARQELMRPKDKMPEDEKLEEDVRQILEIYQSGNTDSALVRLGKFLSTPLDEETLRPLESAERSPEEEKTLNLVLNVLSSLLNLLILRS